MTNNQIDISVNGKWRSTPAVYIDGKTVISQGTWMKMAAIHDEAWLEGELEDPRGFIEKLRRRRREEFPADIFTFAQKVSAPEPKYDFQMEPDSIAVARFGKFTEWWDKLPQETRKNVRRSQKRGVVISVKPFDDELVRGIQQINDDSPMRQGRPNAHYHKPFEQVKRDHSSFVERSDFIYAEFEGEPAGYLKLVYRGEVASILNLASKAAHYDKRPSNALVAKAIELAAAKGISHVTYGMYNYGNKQESPLRDFKDRNGFEEVLTPRFFVPLNPWGAMCLAAGFHHGLLAMLPESLITFGLKCRTKWYNRSRSSSRCSSTVEQPNSTRQTGCSSPPAGSKA